MILAPRLAVLKKHEMKPQAMSEFLSGKNDHDLTATSLEWWEWDWGNYPILTYSA